MGNGSMKSKRYKHNDGSGASSNGRAHKDHGGSGKNSSLDSLRARVEELEREGKRKDEELSAKEQQIKGLQEQLVKQTRALAELSEEMQNKCIQLSKLQDVMKNQSSASAQASASASVASRPPSIKTGGRAAPTSASASRKPSTEGKAPRPGCRPSPRPGPTTPAAYPSSPSRTPGYRRMRALKMQQQQEEEEEEWVNQYLKRLELQQVKDMVECMYECTYQQGEYVIKQGEPGNHLFVLAGRGLIIIIIIIIIIIMTHCDGKLDVFQHNKLLTSITVWTTFGELAILYNCTRTASVRAVNKVRTWALDREVFQNIMRRTAETRQEHVSLLANLPEDKLSKIVDCLEVEYYDKGEYIIREGEEGSTFFIIAQGKVM
ncbi:hypothetical protein INR49_026896 [Caranx melampygus]|nr:hypothetical protein INR49_026896 [Caranx melampygus]